MLNERKDLWKPERLLPHLEQDRDNSVRRWPRWVRIKGERIPVFHANEANACQRRLCFALLGHTPQPNDALGAMRLYDGNPHADSVVFWLGKMGYEVTDREKSFKRVVKTRVGRLAVSGHLDGMILAPEGKRSVGSIPYVLEIKGLSTFTMKKSSEEVVNKSYRAQAQVYMWLTGVPRTLFVIKDKNNSSWKFFELLYNPKFFRSLVAKWTRILTAVKSEELLDREYARDSLECEWCRHNDTCWGGDTP